LASLLSRLWNYLLIEPLDRIGRENRAFLASERSRRPDIKVMVVLVVAAVVLALQNYLGRNWGELADWFDFFRLNRAAEWLRGWDVSEYSRLASYVYWALFSFVTYFFIPALVILVFFRERLSDYGFKPHGALADWPIYLVFLSVMFPLLIWVSTHDHFQRTYPFYKPGGDPLWPNSWIWEATYFLQFVGLEFFFRGFMVHGTKHRFGVYSVFVMAVPYCMIHFGKPALETCGAIIAGVVLGFMSLKTRSIWMGAAIHMTVALSMDFLSLWRQGYFG
jgi:membrane protease YdiL (CAAX protease family)